MDFQFITGRTLQPKPELQTSGRAWQSIRVRQILYVPVSSPSPNFYGGNRQDSDSAWYVDHCTTRLRPARSYGAGSWFTMTFGTSTPTLLRRWSTSTKDGKTIPALVQTSKQGFSIRAGSHTPASRSIRSKSARYRSHRCPARLPRQRSRMWQRPKPVVDDRWPGVFELADIASFGYCSRKLKELVYEGRFTPPSLKGSLIYPATIGGVEWGGGAVDPNKQIFVVNNSSAVQIYRLIARKEIKRDRSCERRLRDGRLLLRDVRQPVRNSAHNIPEPDGHAVLETAIRIAFGV